MTNKDSLELLNMFIQATQIAKSRDKIDFHLNITASELAKLLKKAFPKMTNEDNNLNLAKKILQS